MFPHSAISAAHIAAMAAAKRAKEEEQMTAYDKTDLDGWEFKIVRSNFGSFSSLEKVQQVCREEAETGWELVEKFDQYRLRFKRRIEHRSRDNSARLDPYRTSPGSGVSGQTVALVIGLVMVVLGIVAFVLLGTDFKHARFEFNPTIILLIVLLVPLIFLIVRKRR